MMTVPAVCTSICGSENINQINPRLFSSKKEDNLYFIMERIEEDNADFWYRYCEWEKIKDSNPPINPNFPLVRYRDVRDAIVVFQESLHFMLHSGVELWVTYASNKPIKKGRMFPVRCIEMCFVVLSSNSAPFVTHAGIFRSYASINRIRPYHKGISMPLHSFAAKVILAQYPQKIYMITVPLPIMRDIFIKSLPAGAVYVGHNLSSKSLESKDWMPIEQDSDPFLFILKDKSNHVIFQAGVKEETLRSKNWWFFGHDRLTPTSTYPYVTVDLAALAAFENQNKKD